MVPPPPPSCCCVEARQEDPSPDVRATAARWGSVNSGPAHRMSRSTQTRRKRSCATSVRKPTDVRPSVSMPPSLSEPPGIPPPDPPAPSPCSASSPWACAVPWTSAAEEKDQCCGPALRCIVPTVGSASGGLGLEEGDPDGRCSRGCRQWQSRHRAVQFGGRPPLGEPPSAPAWPPPVPAEPESRLMRPLAAMLASATTSGNDGALSWAPSESDAVVPQADAATASARRHLRNCTRSSAAADAVKAPHRAAGRLAR